MSAISNVHNITAYTTGVTKPYSGQRLSTVTYKTDRTTQVKPDSVCVSVPVITSNEVAAHINEFLPHIIALVQRTQDIIIRSIYESKRSVVSDEDISVSAVLEYLDSESTGGRITKVQAAEWFDTVIADPLAVALASRLGASVNPTQEQADHIEQLLNDFKDKISSLTAGNTRHNNDTITVLRKAISFAPAQDSIAEKFIARLDVMSRKVSVSIADAL